MTDNLREFHGPNAGYIMELYARYQEDPHSVDEKAQALFARWSPAVTAIMPAAAPTNGYSPASATPSAIDKEVVTAVAPSGQVPANVLAAAVTSGEMSNARLEKAMAVANLAQAIREYGHLAARSNPLYDPPGDPSLDPAYHGLTAEDLHSLPASLVGGPITQRTNTAYEGIELLREVYCGGSGYDYDHLTNPEERLWLREAAESRRFRQEFDPDGDNAIRLLKRLTKVETFEQFLHRTFVGKKRFSIEGLDMMVPVVDEIIRTSMEFDVKEIVMGMAHRGRLNVMAHVLNKLYADILREFKDPISDAKINSQGYLGKVGDVKYHKGGYRVMGSGLKVKIAPNPSHLEHVNPVVEGMARAASTDCSTPGAPNIDHHGTLPLQIHGDASFSGQGIVAETLNFTDLDGYENGGTIHIIANNQVGFTTVPRDARSTRYASDLAKGFKIPIVHVNANDPISCIEVARLAAMYRNTFNKDFLIDLVGYRRYGHNEGDEPRFTQPMMYGIIDQLPTVLEMWADICIKMGFITREAYEAHYDERINVLKMTSDKIDLDTPTADPSDEVHEPIAGIAKRTQTALPAEQLRVLHKAVTTLPDGFTPHNRLNRVIRRRQAAVNDPEAKTIDWGTAELLAFASLLSEGTPIRLTGEDVKRGTFSHRHAVYFDSVNGQEYIPLQSFPQAEASFEIHNSPLTENAMIGFEFGYNIEKPNNLVLWEAQFGDFVNGAQAMIDEYLSSGRAKWNLTPSLVLLLPHGYEGQGPDHSSARLERFLQLTAEKNMRVVNCSSAAQYYHLIRRQGLLLEKDPLPLVVMSPKSLLRHPAASSSLNELANGSFQAVIADDQVNAGDVQRLVLCSGKVYVDLVSSPLRAEQPRVAVGRIEQLYPFPKQEIVELFALYPNLEEVVWLQEEPRNMGAWRFMQPRIGDILPLKKGAKTKKVEFKYIGRRRFASPSEGSTSWHKVNQDYIVNGAFDLSYIDKVLEAKRGA